MRYVELRRHTDNDGDRLTPRGVADAEAIGGRLRRPYAAFVSSGAVRCRDAQDSAGRGRSGGRTDHRGDRPAVCGRGSVARDFWNRSLQSWQSEFLAVGWMAVLSIYLRERGSPESNPVGRSYDSTGVAG